MAICGLIVANSIWDRAKVRLFVQNTLNFIPTSGIVLHKLNKTQPFHGTGRSHYLLTYGVLHVVNEGTTGAGSRSTPHFALLRPTDFDGGREDRTLISVCQHGNPPIIGRGHYR
jgi:hypothetical protein